MGEEKTVVKAVAGFFRVFDVAFFLPGAALFFAARRMIEGISASTGFSDVGQAVEAVVICFVLGMICHWGGRRLRVAVTWVVASWRRHRIRPQAEGHVPAYKSNDELRLYLWNLSTLSWNLATAAAVVLLLMVFRGVQPLLLWIVPVVLAVVLSHQAVEFRDHADWGATGVQAPRGSVPPAG